MDDELTGHHHRLVVPYVAIVAATWILLDLSGLGSAVELAIAAVLQLGVLGLLINWRPGSAGHRRFILATLGFIAAVALIRDAGGSSPGTGALVLLPILVAAIRARRRELVLAWGTAALSLYLPAAIVGGPQYPAIGLRGITLLLLVGAVVGETVLRLMRTLYASQDRQSELIARQRRLTEDVQAQLVAENALAAVATLVAAGAPATELFAEVSRQLATVAGASMGSVVRFPANPAESTESAPGEIVGCWPEGVHRGSDGGADDAAVRVDLSGETLAARVFRGGHSMTRLGEAGGAVGAPIFVQGRLWGAACASFEVGEVAPADLQERFERFADLVAMALANAETVSQLVQDASTDPLTRIPNRRAFFTALRVELERADRRGRPLALALLDVDHFKAVNDTHGHHSGDMVLRAIAAALAAQARTGDTVARLGGEEFVWLMPEASVAEAVRATERGRAAVAALVFDEIGSVTLSAGVSGGGPGSSERDLLVEADEALYAAKHGGRNRTMTAELDRVGGVLADLGAPTGLAAPGDADPERAENATVPKGDEDQPLMV